MAMEGPPVRYPNLSTEDVYRAGESTLAGSTPPLSPRQELPVYPIEGGPPIYEDDELDAKEKAARAKAKSKVRKILLIRLLSSIFITVLVSLFVAAVVGRIENERALERMSHREQILNTTIITITAMPDRVKQTLAATSTTTTATTTTTTTRHHKQVATRSRTTASLPLQTASSMTRETITFECPNMYFTATATSTGDFQSPTNEATPEPAEDDGHERRIIGVSVYSMDNCRVARTTYKGLGDDLRYRCTLSCDGGGILCRLDWDLESK
ncbi:hypothetical protein PT974_08130 [Cladobotryum mycophilum]|uniref:Uncharacterized protein n=1 Tax=Cladobotryum mycophilum TaxID=491253 RepID=A0ABR0SCH0_9HYPO